MEEPAPGLYELLVTRDLQERLTATADDALTEIRALESGEAPDRIALHLAREIESTLIGVPENERAAVGVRVAGALLERLGEILDADTRAVTPVSPASVLHAILRRRPDGRPDPASLPLTPLLDTTLLTNAPGEPNLWSQLRSEIASAEGIDVVMAFIRRSGIAPLIDDLKRHCDRGGTLRVLTTTYTGSTEAAALARLSHLGAQVKVSYDRSATRLHAKAWVFRRRSGFSTAYVGSSNLTHSAQVTGAEWNVRASEARNRGVLDKFAAVFDAYWASGDYEDYDPARFDEERRAAQRAAGGPSTVLSPIELRPRPFQERLLELVEVARGQGHHRNLLVSATGTGKTVMAALDYAALRSRLPRARLLFIAHRNEILDQSMATFRHALRDATFGEKWVGGERPQHFEHVFASIQSLARADLGHLPPDHFDVVVVDEFHHAAADTYARVLGHVTPLELLGMTATPERSDGRSILGWFDDRVAAELRLWDAIDQQYLAPFLYFGIHDGVDLRSVPWKRGQGYDPHVLSDVYTGSDLWAHLVVRNLRDHTDVGAMRCLGFCVSVDHAEFMAASFEKQGIPAVAVSGASPPHEREAALKDLSAGRVRVVFSVDIFNEGVDAPNVDTVLMLRPTESPVLFLQQLGRGLRRTRDKPFCTVLDFVGTHRREFRFDRRYRALLGGTRRDLERSVDAGFPFLPSGCSMQLDRVATEVVLRSIRQAIPSNWRAKVDELRALRRENPAAGLAEYLAETGLELEDVYEGDRGWSQLCQAAGVPVLPAGSHEAQLRRGIGRLLHVDDGERIAAYADVVDQPEPPRLATLTERRRRLVHMLVAVLANRDVTRSRGFQETLDLLWEHPQVLNELGQLLGVLRERIDHVHQPLATHPDAPLQIHARYSRAEILAAVGHGDRPAQTQSWQTGVQFVPAANADLLAFTLDKSSGGFSPTTRYRDYAVSRRLIHWESQGSTRENSTVGQRYIHHAGSGHTMLLFARLNTTSRAFWFLGPGSYRSHVGERPMAITWELDVPLPGDLYAAFAAAA